MHVFHVFWIVQMISNRTKHHINSRWGIAGKYPDSVITLAGITGKPRKVAFLLLTGEAGKRCILLTTCWKSYILMVFILPVSFSFIHPFHSVSFSFNDPLI